MEASKSSWKRFTHHAAIKKSIRSGDIGSLEKTLRKLDEMSCAELFAPGMKEWDPVHIAAEEGQLEAIALLIEYGAQIDSSDYLGVTPLMLACRGGHEACAALLIGRGANIFCVDRIHRWNSLHHAAIRGSCGCIELLLEACKLIYSEGLNLFPDFLNQRDSRGITALHLAALGSRAAPAVSLLLEEGAIVSIVVRSGIGQGSTPLHFAARSGGISVVLELLSWGANRNMTDCEGRTPYSMALLYGHGVCAEILNPSVPEPLIWPSPFKCSTMANLEEGARKLLKSALEKVNKERLKPSGSEQFRLKMVGRKWKVLESLRRFRKKGRAGDFKEGRGNGVNDCDRLEESVETTEKAAVGSGDEDEALCGVCFEFKSDIQFQACGHCLCASCTVSMCCHMKPIPRSKEPRKLLCPFCRSEVERFSVVG